MRRGGRMDGRLKLGQKVGRRRAGFAVCLGLALVGRRLLEVDLDGLSL